MHEDHSIICDARRVRAGSERAAEDDIRKPKMAARCAATDGVSRLAAHERQASAHAPHGIRKWKP
jgi:hypothetical protein